jgi:hypothetical protein
MNAATKTKSHQAMPECCKTNPKQMTFFTSMTTKAMLADGSMIIGYTEEFCERKLPVFFLTIAP